MEKYFLSRRLFPQWEHQSVQRAVPQAQVEVVKDLSTQQVHWAVQAVPRAPPTSVPQAGGRCVAIFSSRSEGQ
jgi:hypothetical protein